MTNLINIDSINPLVARLVTAPIEYPEGEYPIAVNLITLYSFYEKVGVNIM